MCLSTVIMYYSHQKESSFFHIFTHILYLSLCQPVISENNMCSLVHSLFSVTFVFIYLPVWLSKVLIHCYSHRLQHMHFRWEIWKLNIKKSLEVTQMVLTTMCIMNAFQKKSKCRFQVLLHCSNISYAFHDKMWSVCDMIKCAYETPKIAMFIGFLFESCYHSCVNDARFGICYTWKHNYVNASNVSTAVSSIITDNRKMVARINGLKGIMWAIVACHRRSALVRAPNSNSPMLYR